MTAAAQRRDHHGCRSAGGLPVETSIMWIESQNRTDDGDPVTTAISIPEIDERVEFSGNGTAQVTADVGEALVREVDSIVEIDADSDADADADTTVEVDE